jgi:AcrR family transcriptional regulator
MGVSFNSDAGVTMKDSAVTLNSRPLQATERARQERSVHTRSQLLKAARKVFARDGFERARLEDIAEEAGKTRGAFYAHFKDKEDVFFAIFEEDIARAQQQLASGLNPASSREKRLDALVAHFTSIIEDRNRMLLTLEFKMYALRKPDRRKRFTDLQTALCTQSPYIDYKALLPEFAVTSERAPTQIAQMCALMDGLALTRLLNPAGLDEEAIEQLVRAGVREILFRQETEKLGSGESLRNS